jgi:RNA polymerase sigma factor (sigma-70 family)
MAGPLRGREASTGTKEQGGADGARFHRASPVGGHALERELVLAAQAGRPEARAELVEAFLPSIGSVARIYRGSPAVERRELMQDGVVGLLRAVDRYDASLDTPFWAYASWWVRQAMQQTVAELTRPLVLSDRALRQLARIKAAAARYVQWRAREPTSAELATSTGLRRQQVEDLIAAARTPRALDEPLTGEEGASGTLGDLVADPRGQDAYDSVPVRVVMEELPGLLETLTERERTIVAGRYGLDGGEEITLRELGDSLGISAERVRQIEQRALDKLREATALDIA